MLAELAAANAAFSIVKKAVMNGREITDCLKSVNDFVNAKDILQKKGNKKKNSIFNGNKAGDDLEEFIALEKIKQQEAELQQIMIYHGRPGLWQDWIKFQAKARVARQKEIERKVRERKKLIHDLTVWALIAGCVIVLALVGILIYKGSTI